MERSESEQVVLAANQRFYDAHESRDMDAMASVWEHTERATCIHPGWPILRGWDQVRTSWEQILHGPGRNQFILTNESVTVTGDLAWVTNDENLVSGMSTATIAATNIYARHGDGWRLILHHGSPVHR